MTLSIILTCLFLISGMTVKALLMMLKIPQASLTSENTGPQATTKLKAYAHNGYLIVFGANSILIFSGVQGDPAGEDGLKLEDAIRDVGLVNQDAMCNVGTDHLFVDSLGYYLG